jgi:hypothetical protein
MSKTLAEWVAAAYAEITVSQQPAAAEDTTAITTKVAPLVADLTARRVYTLVSTAAIPDSVFLDLTYLLAEHSAPLFGKEPNREKIALSEANLRAISRADRTITSDLVRRVLDLMEVYGSGKNMIDATAVAEHAEDIIAELSERGVVTVNSIEDVEPAVLPNLARYIAAALSAPPLYPIMDKSARELRTQTRTKVDETPYRALYY